MRCLVTGGAGFIGSHLVDALLADGHEVVALDNLANGRESNLEKALSASRCTFLRGDVTNQHEVTSSMSGVDWVFHLAALADIVPSIEEPMKYHQANVDGTITVLEAARKAGVKRFIYAASSSCYGIPQSYPTPETAPIRPMYPYALSKYLGEEIVLHWGQTYGLPVVSLRFFNVYGPRSRTSGTYGAVFGVFLAQKLAGKPFSVVGDGNQTRDFTYVTDVADAVYAAARSGVTGEVFNVGSGSTYSINLLVKLLEGPVTYIPKRPGEPDSTFADISKITSALNWKPKIDFETGVSRMLDSIDNWKDAPVWDVESIAEATKAWHQYLGK